MQVNGKVRCKLTVNADIDENSVYQTAMKDEHIIKQLEGKKVVKKIYIKNKLLSIVVN